MKKNKVFVDDVKKAWSWFSVQIASFMGVAQGVYAELQVVREWIDPTVFSRAMAILAIILIVGRIVKQNDSN